MSFETMLKHYSIKDFIRKTYLTHNISPISSRSTSKEQNLRSRFSAKQNHKFVKRNWKMSAGGAFGGNRGLRPVPPEKGIFPLDHMHECDLEKKEYINCLKTSGFQSEICRQFTKKYLECRMEKNLMAKQDMSELGFKKEYDMEASKEKNEKTDSGATPSLGLQEDKNARRSQDCRWKPCIINAMNGYPSFRWKEPTVDITPFQGPKYQPYAPL